MDHASQATKGKRLWKLLGDEVQQDELFWGQDVLKEEDRDDWLRKRRKRRKNILLVFVRRSIIGGGMWHRQSVIGGSKSGWYKDQLKGREEFNEGYSAVKSSCKFICLRWKTYQTLPHKNVPRMKYQTKLNLYSVFVFLVHGEYCSLGGVQISYQ